MKSPNQGVQEDEINIKKHVDQLQAEMKKKQPSLALLSDKMKRTADYRKEFCHSNTLVNVLLEFPCLKMTSFVSNVCNFISVRRFEL
jgi:hypothetical protein